MKIEISGKNYIVRDRLKDLIEKKVEKLEKFFDKPVSAKVICSASSDKSRFKMEITLNSSGKYIRSEVETDNMYADLDLCLARIERQLVKSSEKWQTKIRKIQTTGVPALELEFLDEIPEYVKPKIVKRKSYELEALAPESAIEQMELIGNTFYVFESKESGRVSIVYKRNDGNYGLIETY